MDILHPLVVIMRTNYKMNLSRQCWKLSGIFSYLGMLHY